MAIALAAVICLASGYLLISFGWPDSRPALSLRVMKLSLAAGFGIGISSIAFFLTRMVGTSHFVAWDITLLALICALHYLARFPSSAAFEAETDFEFPSWLRTFLIAAFVIAALAAFYSVTMTAVTHPHGDGWDAFAIWNLHSRFLFLGGPHWRDGFNALIPWSHPDYPLLLPAATARFWSYAGIDSPMVPAALGLVFTFSTLLLLVSSLFQLRGQNAALLAGIALSATPFLAEHGAAQYADVPLSFFILAAIVLLHFGSRLGQETQSRRPNRCWTLAGVAVGFAAWTKNEGLLFLAVLFFAFCLFAIAKEWKNSAEGSTDRWRYLLPSTVLGAIPILAIVAWFKHSIATSGDLLSSPDIMIQKVLTPGRYGIILQWYAKEFLRFGHWWIFPGTVLLIAFYLLVRTRGLTVREPLLHISITALTLTLAGCFMIYVITPLDLYWHLRFSLNRLFLQLWPATIFLFFLIVGRRPSPDFSK
jgi:Dolichyl-phosphate-mannose-protein mannosyltransferase